MGIVSILIIFFMIELLIDHRWIKTTRYSITSHKISSDFENFKILQLSDLHGIDFKNSLPQQIEKENPDIIVMTGDMVSSSQKNFDSFFSFARKIVSKYSVFYIIGNHEGRMAKEYHDTILKTLKAIGVKILDNEVYRIEKENSAINLYGLWVDQQFYLKSKKENENLLTKEHIEKQLGECHRENFNVLLMHTPLYFDAYANWGADLVLCGHIHGGLIRIPGFGGVYSPHRVFFPHYDYGKFEKNGSTMIISSGLSRGEAGFRFFNRPEIVSITLHTKEQ